MITVIFSKMLISNNSEASNRNLELVRLRMNDLFVNTEMNSGIVVSNYYIQKALNTSNYYTRYQYEPLIRSILDPMTISKSYISSIVIYCNDGYAIASNNVNYQMLPCNRNILNMRLLWMVFGISSFGIISMT